MSEPTPTAIAAERRPSLFRNYISFAGFTVIAAALTSFALLVLLEFTGGYDNPYSDLVTYILVPSVLGFGVFVVLAGGLWERRRRRGMHPDEIGRYPILDLNDPTRRRSVITLLTIAFAFLFLTAFGSYRAFEYTESVAFCGQACHTVMKPEFIAHQNSPHANVRCVECHVGPGVGGYVQAKFNGMHQLYGVVSGHYNRPIDVPVANMRSATETCEKCHWPQKYNGDMAKVFNHYGYDEKNSLSQTRMLIHVGGGDPAGGPVGGIHWHMNVANEIDFIASEPQRQVIPWVRMKDMNGKVVEFKTADYSASQSEIANAAKRRMDCIDCHSRPAHRYLTPDQAVNQSLDAGKLDTQLPFLKAKAVELLTAHYTTNDEALAAIASGLGSYYQANYPNVPAASVQGAIAEVQRIYQVNFFPEMKTDYQASYDNIGHYYSQGCFRCHDGKHFSPEGRVIRNDCTVCHSTIDQSSNGKLMSWSSASSGESSGRSIAAPAPGEFRHPVDLGSLSTRQCSSCHSPYKAFVHPVRLGDISMFQCVACHKRDK